MDRFIENQEEQTNCPIDICFMVRPSPMTAYVYDIISVLDTYSRDV